MPRTHGYSFKGHRCYGQRAWGERGRINAIGALLNNQLITVSLFEGTTDKAMQEQLFLAGFTLEYLPPYSPDLNPIEHKWAHAKSIRRKINCSIDELFQSHC